MQQNIQFITFKYEIIIFMKPNSIRFKIVSLETILKSLKFISLVVKNLFGFTDFQALKLGMQENVTYYRKVLFSI